MVVSLHRMWQLLTLYVLKLVLLFLSLWNQGKSFLGHLPAPSLWPQGEIKLGDLVGGIGGGRTRVDTNPYDGDAPEPEACAYISNSPVSPTLERDHNLSLLKARAMDPMSAEQSPTTQDASEHPRAPQDAPSQPGSATQHPYNPQGVSTPFRLSISPLLV